MGSSGSASNVTEEDARCVFARLEEPCTPLSATEVAEKLDCPDGTAKQHLEALADCGELQTRRVDGQRQVWWSTDHVEATNEESELEEYEAFIHAVEEYAIFLLNPAGTIASWNEGAERIKGHPKAKSLMNTSRLSIPTPTSMPATLMRTPRRRHLGRIRTRRERDLHLHIAE